jgi:4-hydroxy-3-methylbut-2-enyl diphosphate reductase
VVATELRTTDGTPPVALPGRAGGRRSPRLGLHVRTGPDRLVSRPASDERRRGWRPTVPSPGTWSPPGWPASCRTIRSPSCGRSPTREGRGPVLGGDPLRPSGSGRCSVSARRSSAGPGPAVPTTCSWPAPARSAPASSGPSRSSSAPRALWRAGLRAPADRPQRPRRGRPGAKGAIFVAELDEVPDGATVVLAAHGVSPAVRSRGGGPAGPDGDRRHLPAGGQGPPRGPSLPGAGLPDRPHRSRRTRGGGRHAWARPGSDPPRATVRRRGGPPVRRDGRPVAYLTQTTLSIDETAEIIGAPAPRFPRLVGPATNDICYATQNRQDAVRALAHVVISCSSSARPTPPTPSGSSRWPPRGCRAELIEDASEIRLSWLDDVASIGSPPARPPPRHW